MRSYPVALLALMSGACDLPADSTAITRSPEYAFIRDRLTEVCDGNLLVIGSGSVIEIKDGADLSPDVTFIAASEADKLNKPEFIGTYIIELTIPDETPYRYIFPTIDVSDWSEDRDDDDAFGVDAIRYGQWTQLYREDEPVLKVTIEAFETRNEITEVRNQQNYFLGWDDMTFSSSMDFDQDDYNPMDALQSGDGFATARANFDRHTSTNRRAWLDAIKAGAPYPQACEFFPNVYYASASVFLGQDTDTVFRNYVTSKFFSEDLIGASDSKGFIRHIAGAFGVDLSSFR